MSDPVVIETEYGTDIMVIAIGDEACISMSRDYAALTIHELVKLIAILQGIREEILEADE